MTKFEKMETLAKHSLLSVNGGVKIGKANGELIDAKTRIN